MTCIDDISESDRLLCRISHARRRCLGHSLGGCDWSRRSRFSGRRRERWTIRACRRIVSNPSADWAGRLLSIRFGLESDLVSSGNTFRKSDCREHKLVRQSSGASFPYGFRTMPSGCAQKRH